MMTLHQLPDTVSKRVSRIGALQFGDHLYWSPETAARAGQWVRVQCPAPQDATVTFWAEHGPDDERHRFEAHLLADQSFFDVEGALAVAKRRRAARAAVRAEMEADIASIDRTATSAPSLPETRGRRRRRLRILLLSGLQEMARAIDLLLTPGMPTQIVRAMTQRGAWHGATPCPEPLPEVAPVRLRSERAAGRRGSSRGHPQSGEAPLRLPSDTSPEERQSLPAQGYRSSEEPLREPSGRNLPSTYAPPAADEGEPTPPADPSQRLCRGSEKSQAESSVGGDR